LKKAPRFWLEHVPDWRDEPMAYWTHVETEGAHFRGDTAFEPPAPAPEARLGFPVLCVESQACVLRFSSRAQLDQAISVLSLSPLPSTRRLCAQRRGAHGPNSHWLSRLPAALKSPKERVRLVEDLRRVAGLLAPGSLRAA
jgi:hypothetical protein